MGFGPPFSRTAPRLTATISLSFGSDEGSKGRVQKGARSLIKCAFIGTAGKVSADQVRASAIAVKEVLFFTLQSEDTFLQRISFSSCKSDLRTFARNELAP